MIVEMATLRLQNSSLNQLSSNFHRAFSNQNRFSVDFQFKNFCATATHSKFSYVISNFHQHQCAIRVQCCTWVRESYQLSTAPLGKMPFGRAICRTITELDVYATCQSAPIPCSPSLGKPLYPHGLRSQEQTKYPSFAPYMFRDYPDRHTRRLHRGAKHFSFKEQP